MARLSTPGARAPDHTSLNLTRLILRLQNTLLEPDAETSRRLRASGFERRKVEAVSCRGGRILLGHVNDMLYRI